MVSVGGRSCRGAYGVVVRDAYMRQVDVPVVWCFVDNYGPYVGHGVINTLRTSVAVGVKGAGSDFPYFEAPVHRL